MTTVSGVRLVRKPATATPSARSRAHVLAAEVVADRRDERGVEPEPRRRHRGDRAAAGRAHELAGEALLAGPGQRLEPDERQVQEGGGGDGEFNVQHGAREPLPFQAPCRSGRRSAAGRRASGRSSRCPRPARRRGPRPRATSPSTPRNVSRPSASTYSTVALERPHHPVLPQPRELRPHADDRVRGRQPEPLGGNEAYPGLADETGHERVAGARRARRACRPARAARRSSPRSGRPSSSPRPGRG